MKKLISLLMVVVVCSACSTAAALKTDDYKESTLTATDAESIEVYSSDLTDKQHQVLGQVVTCADAGESSEIAVDLLKVQAANLGADAIINLRISFAYGQWSSAIKATGTAVKYK